MANTAADVRYLMPARLGFAREDALQSVTEAPNVNADIDEDGARTNALEWLLLNLPEQRLPKQFAVNGDSMKVWFTSTFCYILLYICSFSRYPTYQ